MHIEFYGEIFRHFLHCPKNTNICYLGKVHGRWKSASFSRFTRLVDSKELFVFMHMLERFIRLNSMGGGILGEFLPRLTYYRAFKSYKLFQVKFRHILWFLSEFHCINASNSYWYLYILADRKLTGDDAKIEILIFHR